MMMMMNKKYIFLLLLIIPVLSFGQEKDFGIWLGVSVEKKLTKKIDLEFSGNIRSFNNSSQIDQEFLEAGLQYKLNKIVSIAGSYRFINTLENDAMYHFRHKLFLDLKASVPDRNLKISGRFRIQRTSRTYFEDAQDEIPQYQARGRFKTDYDFGSFPLDPYVYAEAFVPLEKNNGIAVSKSRFSAGATLTVSRRSSIDFEYIYQKDTKPYDINTSILSLNYLFKF